MLNDGLGKEVDVSESDFAFIYKFAWGGIGFCCGVFIVLGRFMYTGIVPSNLEIITCMVGFSAVGALFPIVKLEAEQVN